MTPSEQKFSPEYAHECFEYREGVLYWRDRPAHHFKRAADHKTFIKRSSGTPAGRSDSRGYVTVKMRVNGISSCITAHRIVWVLHHGKWPDHTIDHINRVRSDNRIENLRDVPMSVNLCNRGNPRGTGIPGVHPTAGERFTAQIRIGDQYIHLGTFDSTDTALGARLLAESAALDAIQKPHHAPLIPLRVMTPPPGGEG